MGKGVTIELGEPDPYALHIAPQKRNLATPPGAILAPEGKSNQRFPGIEWSDVASVTVCHRVTQVLEEPGCAMGIEVYGRRCDYTFISGFRNLAGRVGLHQPWGGGCRHGLKLLV